MRNGDFAQKYVLLFAKWINDFGYNVTYIFPCENRSGAKLNVAPTNAAGSVNPRQTHDLGAQSRGIQDWRNALYTATKLENNEISSHCRMLYYAQYYTMTKLWLIGLKLITQCCVFEPFPLKDKFTEYNYVTHHISGWHRRALACWNFFTPVCAFPNNLLRHKMT